MIYEVAKNKDIYTLLSELATRGERDLEVFIPEGALILQNKLNLQFLSDSLEKLGKSVTFETDDPRGVELLSNITTAGATDYGEAYASSGEDQTSPFSQGIFAKIQGALPSVKAPKMPKISLPLSRSEGNSGFRFKLNFIFLGIAAAVIIVLTYGVYRYVSSQKAYIKIVTKSEPMARSLTIRVDSQQATNIENKILEGRDISTSLFETAEIETTGEKVVGEYAEGEITLFNGTEEEIELDEGTLVEYKEDDEDLAFELQDDVTIPGFTYEVAEDPTSDRILGEASVLVKAVNYGEDYNISEGEILEFDDYKKSELVAKSKEDFKGGSSETVAIVSEEDVTNLKTEVAKVLEEKADSALKDAVPEDYKMIDGSMTSVLGDFEIDQEVGDEAEKISIKQSATVTGLAYAEKKLDQLIMQIVGEYVPDEYALSGTKHTLNVEVLGETEDTVLSATTADLQVTVKTSVVPDIDVSALKEELQGKSLDEVQRHLGSMRSVSTYEFSLSPPVPFKTNVPSDTNRILVEIESE
ncbi:hypothetical protein GF360_01705 [candidate division WWE3 bacterium]|nr:hypothetical protein [candidate division WWE3 bacterium]